MKEKIETRRQLIAWTIKMIPDPYQKTPAAGASYNASIRNLEFTSRPLWAVFSMLAGDCCPEDILAKYIKRIKEGMAPDSQNHFPWPMTKTRQTAVEMAVYGYGLLACGDKLLSCFSKEEQKGLEDWLYSINMIEFPKCNWYFFLLFVNLGLQKNHMKYSEERMQEAYDWIESAYVGEGWYEDGCAGQRDYYVPFAFHFYSLLIDHYCPSHQLKDVQKRAELFQKDYIYDMDSHGRTIPFGRSQTYRFAHSCFWSACAVTGLPGISMGELRARIFSNLNYWQEQDIMQDGLLSIGYAYPNQLMSEEYNAYGSPMWALKTMIVLSLPAEHAFWQEPVQLPALPETIHPIAPAGFLVVTGSDHFYALSGLQYSGAHIFQFQSKYGKFCYSTGFGWNLNRDVQGINQFAADSALALSVKGTDQFSSRGDIQACHVHTDYIYSRWNYGTAAEIESFLIPVDEETHIRIHRIQSRLPLVTYEGAFPVFGWNYKFQEPLIEGRKITLKSERQYSAVQDLFNQRTPQLIKQGPNTNIYDSEPNGIPALYGEIDTCGKTVCFGCIVSGNPETNIPEKSQDIQVIGNQVCINGRTIVLKEQQT